MQATITLALNSVVSFMAMHKETNNTEEEPNNPHHKEFRDHRIKRNMQKFMKSKAKLYLKYSTVVQSLKYLKYRPQPKISVIPGKGQ